MPSDLSKEGLEKLAEIQEEWSPELRAKWRTQKDANEFVLDSIIDKGKFVRLERRVDRVTIEVRLQRGDLTWVLREVARVPDGEDRPDRVRFSHPQGKVDGSDQELGDEMKWHNAAHRELLEETGFDLHLINENNERVFPENVNEDAEYVVRSFLSQCRESEETNHLGGTFPGITRITQTRHYVGQLIEPAGKLIDLLEPIIEEVKDKNGKIINRHFFRWFPSTEGFNTDFGEDSAGIQPTHPYDLLDALKQARRIHYETNVSWNDVYAGVNDDEDIGKHGDTKWVAGELDEERKSDTRKAGDLEWGKHGVEMQSKLHLGHRQAAIVRFNKILLRQAQDSNKSVHPLIPYGQLSREFGLRVLSDAKNAGTMNALAKVNNHIETNENCSGSIKKMSGGWECKNHKDERFSVNPQTEIWGIGHSEGTKEAPIPTTLNWTEKELKDGAQKVWSENHGYIILALNIECPHCEGVVAGQPCPQPWAYSLHGNRNKTRLPKVTRKEGINAEYLNEIRNSLDVTPVGWENLQPESEEGWSGDWATKFPLVCSERILTVSQNLDLEELVMNTVSLRKTQRGPKRYLSSKTVSPATLRNRIIHSLQRYILQSRIEEDNLKRFHIQKWNLQHVLQHPIVRLFDTEKWGAMEGKDLDDRSQHGVKLNIFDYSTTKRLHKTKKEHEWTIFDVLEPGQNLGGREKGFLPSVQVDAPLFEIFSAFAQGHPAVVIRRDYYVNKDGEKWPKPKEIPTVDVKVGLEIDDGCITPGQLIQSAAEQRTVLMNEDILQVRCALGVLEADTFLHTALPSLQEILTKEE